MVSKFTIDFLNSLKGKTLNEKLKSLDSAIKSELSNSTEWEIKIAIRMLEEGKFIYQTDNFTNIEAMNIVHDEIFSLLEIGIMKE
jgi:hypothetical protein